jgi:Nif-specific regulatory protein
MSVRVLIVEDDQELREALVDTLELSGIDHLQAANGEEAVVVMRDQGADMVISDVNMPGMDGHALLAHLRQNYPAVPVALITAFGQVEKAVEAIRSGAADYLMKPFEPDQLVDLVRSHVGTGGKALAGRDEPVAESAGSRQLLQLAQRVAQTDSTVLITGESGTGKELVACAIHYNSPKAHNPFVKLNCAALPENLLESELFGHEKGAFTGAVKMRQGRFEQADGGTLFLDEIGEISPLFQAKLLRVLQEGEFERVGGNKTIRVNVRIVAATNRDLENEVREGNFREDLYYRLNIMPINLPALRERKADIPELCNFLLEKLSQNQGRKLTLDDAAVRVLMGHAWPGNVRELENVLERAAIMTEDGVIEPSILSLQGLDMQRQPAPMAPQAPIMAPTPPAGSYGGDTGRSLDDPGMDERERVIAALEQAGWVQAKAARLLNMTPRQIAYRIQTMNIDVKKI